MGDGICPFDSCTEVQSLTHIFWDCQKVKPVLKWVQKVFGNLVGYNVHFHHNLFMFGFPEINCTKHIFDRIWFIICVAKFIVWKSRCLYIFESKFQSEKEILSIIINSIKIRVEADRTRFCDAKFRKLWTIGKSFVTVSNDQLLYKL